MLLIEFILSFPQISAHLKPQLTPITLLQILLFLSLLSPEHPPISLKSLLYLLNSVCLNDALLTAQLVTTLLLGIHLPWVKFTQYFSSFCLFTALINSLFSPHFKPTLFQPQCFLILSCLKVCFADYLIFLSFRLELLRFLLDSQPSPTHSNLLHLISSLLPCSHPSLSLLS